MSVAVFCLLKKNFLAATQTTTPGQHKLWTCSTQPRCLQLMEKLQGHDPGSGLSRDGCAADSRLCARGVAVQFNFE